MARWLVFLYWFTPSSVWSFRVWNDNFVRRSSSLRSKEYTSILIKVKPNRMCEEVRQPAIQVPRAIIGGILLNFLAGLAFLIPICFVLPEISMLANLASGQPVPTIIKSAVGNSAGAFCLHIPLIILGLICGVGCVTAASRSTWAFARDGAIPGSKWFRKVDATLGIPLNSMLLGMVIELLLGLIYFGSTAAFNAFSGVGVIFLIVSYACPVAVSFVLRRRKALKYGNFDLGILGVFCNVVCLGKYSNCRMTSSSPRRSLCL